MIRRCWNKFSIYRIRLTGLLFYFVVKDLLFLTFIFLIINLKLVKRKQGPVRYPYTIKAIQSIQSCIRIRRFPTLYNSWLDSLCKQPARQARTARRKHRTGQWTKHRPTQTDANSERKLKANSINGPAKYTYKCSANTDVSPANNRVYTTNW